MLRAVRNVHPYREITNELRRQGYEHNYKQCRKIKALKKRYKETVDRLRRSGVGVDSEDNLKVDDVQFKWFAKIHGMMGGRVVVNPPEVLDTSDRDTQHSPPAILGTEEEQGEQPQQPSGPQNGEQEPSAQSDEQEPSTQNGEQHSSVQSAEVPGPSGLQNAEQLGHSVAQSWEPAECSRTASKEQSATAGSWAKKGS